MVGEESGRDVDVIYNALLTVPSNNERLEPSARNPPFMLYIASKSVPNWKRLESSMEQLYAAHVNSASATKR